jgi:SAM-dependent methyltransferase
MDYVEHYKRDSEEFDYFEERFGATQDDEKRLREYILSKVPPRPVKVLDAGCGSAWAAQSLLPTGKFVISADISLRNVKKALEKYPSANHSGIVCDALHLPFKENTLDCVIASEIIEHTVDPQTFVKSLLGTVKQNGVLLVSTPYKEKIIYTLCVHCNQKTPLHAHLHSFNENILTGYGFDAKAHRAEYSLFGNKYLIFGRTYVILRYLPFTLWKFIDNLFNKVLGKPVHILVEYYK